MQASSEADPNPQGRLWVPGRQYTSIVNASRKSKKRKAYTERFERRAKRHRRTVGSQFCLVQVHVNLIDQTIEDITIQCSRGLQPLVEGVKLLVSAQIFFRQSVVNDHTSRLQQVYTTIEQLDLDTSRSLIKFLIERATEKPKSQVPYKTTDSGRVKQLFPWYPE